MYINGFFANMENDLLGSILKKIVMEKMVRDKMLNLDKSMHKIRF